MNTALRLEGPTGLSVMKFTLTYDGPLSSQGSRDRFAKKWAIREQLNPQLAELWRTHPTLKNIMKRVARDSYYLAAEQHHQSAEGKPQAQVSEHAKQLDLCAPIVVGGISFVPLVRDSYALVCSLNITFLRNEAAGRVYQGGDLDNRIKTFLDALKVPQSEADNVAAIQNKPTDPIYCLLEDDSLITGLNVQTTRLLTAPNLGENYVRLLVEVDVRVTHPRAYNSAFLGD
jgi:hypothetical protein